MNHATVTNPSPWLFREATQMTPEQALVAEFGPELVGKFGFAADYDYRPAIHCGPVVRKGLAIQANPMIARDWWQGFADWQGRTVQ